MGGKSYWCDYCECFMKNDINVRKNHNLGTAHHIAKANYLQKFKAYHRRGDHKIALQENFIQLGYFCRFSHYSPEQLQHLKFMVDKNRSKKEKDINEANALPWNTSKRRKVIPSPAPPSLQPIDFEQTDNSCFQSHWG